MTKSKKREGAGYLHGYSSKEQQRLYEQANFLERWVYQDIDLRAVRTLIEVGCGVGAQTSILLRRFPQLEISGVDLNEKQIAQAKSYLKKPIREGRVNVRVADATKLPFADSAFDGAFFCWLLEHVPDPVAILRETLRTLKSGAVVYCTEVQNASFFVEPYSPAVLKYWFELNEQQWTMKGDPFVGAKLGNLLKEAGYQNIETRVINFHFDSRAPKQRAEFIKYWTELMLSAAPALMRSKRVTKELVDEMARELKVVAEAKDSVFFYNAIQARAQAL